MSHENQNLPVYDHRPGQGPTLVFLHYWGGSARTWERVVKRLPDRGVLSFDFRGWGRSRELPGPYGLEQLAQDTLDIVRNAGLTDYVLVGHSMGGKVAQLVAATRPEGLSGLVLVGPGPARPGDAITPEYQAALASAYDTAESVAAARDSILTATPLDEQAQAQVVTDSRSTVPEAREAWPLHGIADDITPHTRMINAPALVLAGENDGVEPPQVLRSNLLPYLTRAELRVLPAIGHLMPLEAPDLIAAALADFAPQAGSSVSGCG